MRTRTVNYFFGSLLSRQAILAYGIAGSITTGFQLVLLWIGWFTRVPKQTESLPIFVEVYIETLLPVWIGTITPWNIAMVICNIILALGILGHWTLNYGNSFWKMRIINSRWWCPMSSLERIFARQKRWCSKKIHHSMAAKASTLILIACHAWMGSCVMKPLHHYPPMCQLLCLMVSIAWRDKTWSHLSTPIT